MFIADNHLLQGFGSPLNACAFCCVDFLTQTVFITAFVSNVTGQFTVEKIETNISKQIFQLNVHLELFA